MKTAISIPDDIFRKAEDVAKRRKLSRSALFTRAVEEYLLHHRQDDVTERLNRLYHKQRSSLDPVIQTLQSLSIPREDMN